MRMERWNEAAGSARILPEGAIEAGSPGAWTLEYATGPQVLRAGGAVRISIPHSFSRPQVADPSRPGFVSPRAEDPSLRLGLEFHPAGGFYERGARRGKEGVQVQLRGHAVYLRILEGALEEGRRLFLDYGRSPGGATAGDYCGWFEFTTAVDPDGSRSAPYSGYELIPVQPGLRVVPGAAASLAVLQLSDMTEGKEVELHLSARDRFENVAEGFEGTVHIEEGPAVRFHRGDGGIKRVPVPKAAARDGRFAVEAGPLPRAVSNPGRPRGGGPLRLWGDLHGHTDLTWGFGSPEAYYRFARDASRLDFAAVTDPGCARFNDDPSEASTYTSPEDWERIRAAARTFDEPGRFVTILGFEYRLHDSDENCGDRCVYYRTFDEPIRRCSDAGSRTPEELFRSLRGGRGIVVPHHPVSAPLWVQWDRHDPEVQRLVEIYSGWGNSEAEGCGRPYTSPARYEGQSVRHALARGYRLGFVAAGDTQSGMPGHSHWVYGQRGYRSGLTCVLAESLTREAIFDALWARRCYATTGERHLLDFTLNGAPMGSEVKAPVGKAVRVTARAVGACPLSRLQIVSQGVVVLDRQVSGEEAQLEEDLPGPDRAGGTRYYYLRLEGEGEALAWVSPVWVTASA
jgi:hypothetical protein